MNERILLAEDEDGLRAVLTHQLRADGFDVHATPDGLAAIEAMEGVEFSAIVTDLRMPGADGMEVLRAAKDLWPNTEVIILTAHGSLEGIIEAVQLGNLFDYLNKPFDDIRELSMLVRKACERRKLQIENQCLQGQLGEIAEKLRANTSKLMQAGRMAGTGQIAGTVAREIRNPLESVVSLAGYLSRKFGTESWKELDAGDRERLIQGLRRMDSAARHCQGVVDTLLRYAGPDGGNFVELELNSILSDTLVLTEQEALHAGLTLETRFAPDVPTVMGVPSRLQQVFTTVILNAVEATAQGGRIHILTARTEGDPPQAFVEISDTGCGIAQDRLPMLFQGDGLGLSLAQDIVRDHHGVIEVESQEGVGTKVRLTLPGLGEIALPTFELRVA